MPELPARAYCAGMASSCYVLKAVDVEMLMLPGVLKDDLRFDSSALSSSAVVPADQPGFACVYTQMCPMSVLSLPPPPQL